MTKDDVASADGAAAAMKAEVDKAVADLTPALAEKLTATPGYLHGEFQGCSVAGSTKYVAFVNLDRESWEGTSGEVAAALTTLDWKVSDEQGGVTAEHGDLDLHTTPGTQPQRLTFTIGSPCHVLSTADEQVVDDDPGTDYPELSETGQ